MGGRSEGSAISAPKGNSNLIYPNSSHMKKIYACIFSRFINIRMSGEVSPRTLPTTESDTGPSTNPSRLTHCLWACSFYHGFAAELWVTMYLSSMPCPFLSQASGCNLAKALWEGWVQCCFCWHKDALVSPKSPNMDTVGAIRIPESLHPPVMLVCLSEKHSVMDRNPLLLGKHVDSRACFPGLNPLVHEDDI